MTPLAVLEILWTVFAVIGVGFSLYNLFDVLTDMKVLSRSNMNGLRMLVARGNIRGEAVRLFILVFFCIMGFVFVTTPNAPETTVSVSSWIVRIGAISINAATLYNTVADRLLRHRIFNFAESMEQRHTRHAEEDRVSEQGERRRARFDRRRSIRDAEIQTEPIHHDLDPATKKGDRAVMRRIEDSLDRIETSGEQVATNLADDKRRADVVSENPDKEAGEAADTYSTSAPRDPEVNDK